MQPGLTPAAYTQQWRMSHKYIGFEVLTAVVMKSSIFWEITPCRPLKVNLLRADFLLGLFSTVKMKGEMFLQNVG
jgi:hypothetical protein